MRKLDTRLLMALQARRQTSSAPAQVGVAVVFTGELAALRAVGLDAPTMVHHPVRQVNIAGGSIAVERLADLVALEEVIFVEGAREMKPEIADSVPEIGAKALHEGIGFLPSLKGAGVVIGIIDSGIDFRHGSFRKADGRTRIIALWDQSLGNPGNPRRPGEAAPFPFNYGVEYLQGHIDGTLGELPPSVSVRSVDRRGHGTHVAGIAASNGLQPGNCHLAGHFVGVAPEADLIVVLLAQVIDATTNRIDPGRLQNAFEYIFTHPLVTDRPVVVNYSQGDNLGPHDGTSVLELTIDSLLGNRPQGARARVVVKSVGNEGGSGRHAEVPVPSGGANLQLHMDAEMRRHRTIEAWYPGAARVSVQVIAPGEPAASSPVVAPGAGLGTPRAVNPTAPADEQTTVTIRSEFNQPLNGDNFITIDLDTVSGVIPENTWTIRFANVGTPPTTVHAWLDNDGLDQTKFLPPFVSAAHTVTTPGTAKHVITVGGYDDRTQGKVGQLAAFSSRGPVRRIVNPQPGEVPHRPDVVAPGVGIMSAKPNVETSCCECCVDFYTALSNQTGTSVAAPHVTGVVALMLQRHPELSTDKVREILRDRADRPGQFSGLRSDEELNSFGFGRVNAVAAVQNVPPFFGGPGPHALPRGGSPGLPSAPHRGGGGALPPAPRACQALAGFAAFRPALAALRRHVLSFPEGQLCAALVSRHFSEARGLIRSNRRVAVAWHRADGPLFLRNLMRALIAREPGGIGARALPGLPDGFSRFFAALARYGSADLRSDVQRHGAEFGTLAGLALHNLQALEPAA